MNTMSIVEERGLTILVPEAENLVQSFRAKHQTFAASSIPAHITINHPFVPGSNCSADVEERLVELFSRIAAFQFILSEIRMFPNVLYLAPEPDEQFTALIDAVAACFPESPPYEGKYDSIIPHLTVTHLDDSQDIGVLKDSLSAVANGILPITAAADRVVLIEKINGKWRERNSFPLAS